MKKLILTAVTGLLLASTAAMAAPATQNDAQAAYGRQTGQYAPSFTQINPTGGN